MAENNQGVKRALKAPCNSRPVSGELLSVELCADEDVRWIWCHHAELGSSVIGYTIVTREPAHVAEKPPIGFFQLEEKTIASITNSHEQETQSPSRLG